MPYSARATTAGTQDALAFSKEFSREHPEFRKGRFDVHVIAPGTALITTRSEAEAQGEEDDPVVGAFLGFLEAQMEARPDRITPFTQADVTGLDELLEDVPSGDDVDWDAFELS